MQRSNQTPATEFVFLAFNALPNLHVLLFLMFFIIYLGILLENIALLIIIILDSRLHIPMYFFLWNLTFLEIGSTFVVIPRLIFSLLVGSNRISLMACAVQMFSFIFLGNAAILIVGVMAYDRYVAVSNPLRYRAIISDIICLKLIITVLVISFLLAFEETFLVFSVPYCGLNEINHFFCDVAQVFILASNCSTAFYIYEIVMNMSAILTFVVPLLIIIISYIYIVVSVLRIRTSDGRRKAFSSCSSHLITVISQFACLFMLYLRPKSSFLWDKNRIFALAFMSVSAISNPLIYSLRNKVVKSAFKKAMNRNSLHS